MEELKKDATWETGLSDRILADLHWTFLRFPEIREVRLFGSRATGYHESGSDIDLAIFAPNLSEQRLALLHDAIHELPLAFRVDLVQTETLENPQLRESILRQGRPFYPNLTETAAQNVLAHMTFPELRQAIYERFHDGLDERFFESIAHDEKRFPAYYTSMYLLQDTFESTERLGETDLSDDPLRRYIEIWGYLQANFIAQDSLLELEWATTGREAKPPENESWRKLRRLRNEIAGHPVKHHGYVRTFFGREDHSLTRFMYERFDGRFGLREYPVINLKQLRDDFFDQVGTKILRRLILYIDQQIRHPTKNS